MPTALQHSPGAVAPGELPRLRNGKREHLVRAAIELLHRQGIERTTLAEIAAHAHIPLGNVYYYFKKKDDIIAAVIEAIERRAIEVLADVDMRYADPMSRLIVLVRAMTGSSGGAAEYGCPLGSLCLELDKRAEIPRPSAGTIMRIPLSWAEGQLRALGRADAHDLALELIARYEGAALLAATLGDDSVLSRAGTRLEAWIGSL